MKQFTSVKDIEVQGIPLSASIDRMIARALDYKKAPWRDVQAGACKRIGLIFLNPSLRTRLSTQVAAQQLGMEAIVFNIGSEGWSWELEDGAVMNGTSVEHIRDAVPVLSSYFDVLAIRTFPGLSDREADYAETVLQQFIAYASVPVISLESATLHPLQSLADLITIQELELKRPKIVLCWAPHIKPLPQCVANSFAQWVGAWDRADFVIAQPPGMELSETFTTGAQLVYDKAEALRDADVVYVKNWSAYRSYGAMGTDQDGWMLQPEDMEKTNRAKIMHCLPVRRNIELSDALLDSSSSIVTRQAANRVWAAQAVLSNIIQSL